MNKETLRMQMLAGVITESEYKAKLNEEIKTTDIESVVKNSVEPLTKLASMRDFFYEKYTKL